MKEDQAILSHVLVDEFPFHGVSYKRWIISLNLLREVF